MEIQNLRNQYKQKIQKNKENLFNKLRFLTKIDHQLTQLGGSEIDQTAPEPIDQTAPEPVDKIPLPCNDEIIALLQLIEQNDVLVNDIGDAVKQRMQKDTEEISKLNELLKKCANTEECKKLQAKIDELNIELESIKKCNEKKEESIDKLKTQLTTHNANLVNLLKDVSK